MINYLEQGDYQSFIKALKFNYQELEQPTISQQISFLTLKNNKLGIINQVHKFNIGTFAESNISILKSLFVFGNKVLGYGTFKNMLNLRLSKINGLKILDLLKQEIKEDNLQRKRFYKLSYWKKTYKNYFIDTEIPLLKSSNANNKNIRNILKY